MQRCRRPGSRRVQGSALRGFVALLALVLLVSTGAGAKSSAAASARVESDLPYVPGGGPKQQLDLYLPASRNFPSLLFVHGGSLSAGDRKEDPYLHVCEPIREAGIGCASISYRLFPLVGWPAPVQDVASAFAWLKQNIRSRGGDPERLFLAGHSSGCMLVALVGADPKYLETHGLMPRDVAGVIAIGCRLNDRLDTKGIPMEKLRRHFETDPYDRMFGSVEALNDAVPMAHAGPGLPPMLILMGDAERFQPPLLEDARAFRIAAGPAAARIQIEILQHHTHLGVIAKLGAPGDPTLPLIVRFVGTAKR